MNLASPWARKTALALADLGQEVHVIDFSTARQGRGTIKKEDEFQVEAVQAFRNKMAGVHLLETRFSSSLRYFTALPAFKKILEKVRPDVLLTLYAGGFANLALLSGFRPYVVYVVGSDVLLSKGISRQLGSSALTHASLVLANGGFLAQKTREMSSAAKVKCLLLGVDTESFTPPARPPGPKVVFFNNRGFSPIYNNEYIIEALSLLKPPLPEFHFHFASLGPGLESTKQLAARILSPAMLANITFWGGVNQAKMLELLRQSHYFVSVSRSDGTATSLLEAMSCGLYPILSDIPQNREWVDSADSNGILAPLDQPKDFADVLTHALLHPEEAAQKSPINRRLIQSRADSHKSMQSLGSMLSSAV